jgi:hyperosmotically inducible protein
MMRMISYLFSVVLFIGIVGCASQPKHAADARTDDAAITAAIRAKLSNDATLHLFRINVDTRQGIVTLSGTLPTEERKQRAAELAARVDGVRQIENLLQVGQTRRINRFEDAVIASKITSRLIQNPLTHTLAIDVEATRGKVVLTGRVQTEQEKKEAERIARNTSGVVSVENQLEVLE